MKEVSPEDILISIGHFMPKDKRGINYRIDEFYNFFLQNKESYPLILGRLMFDWNGAFPTCEQLAYARDNLAISGMLNFCLTMNGYYQFDKAVDYFYEEHISKEISTEQAKGLEELAKKFEAEFGCESRFKIE